MPRPTDGREELRAKLKAARTMLGETRRERDEAKDEAELMGQVLDAIMSRAEKGGKIDYDEICGIIGASPTPKGACGTNGGGEARTSGEPAAGQADRQHGATRGAGEARAEEPAGQAGAQAVQGSDQ